MARRSDILRGGGKFFEVGKKLIEGIFDNGGDDLDVERIRDDQETLTRIARILVGGVWDLVGKTFTLDVEWDLTEREFYTKYEACIVASGIQTPSDGKPPRYTETKCVTGRYQLVHYEKPVGLDQVLVEYRPAGFRELVTLAAGKFNIGGRIDVIAAGSTLANDRLGSKTFPCLTNFCHVGWSGFRREQDCIFDTDTFFLVRI